MPQLLIVSGPPGAGKSAVAAALVERWEPSVLVEGDVFFHFLRRGAIAPWLVEAHAQNTVVTLAAGAATGALRHRWDGHRLRRSDRAMVPSQVRSRS
jgi:predicted ATPase